jgi:hypothetical protein
MLKYAEKNAKDNNGKHICRQCVLRSKNPMQQQLAKDKFKKTNLERYGVTTDMNTKENIESRRKLFEDKEYKEKWLEKHRETSRKKYGTDYPMQSIQVQENQKAAMREIYGVDHPYQSPEIMAQMRANNLKKYGVENVASLPSVQAKMAKTTLEKYGVEHYNQLPEMKNYLRENCRDWLAESYANPWAKGITRPEEWNQKQRETVGKLILSGNWSGGFVSNCRGRYPARKCRKQMPRFLSSLELQMHFFLDNNLNVEWYDYEPLAIPYLWEDGTQHLYFPDFLVKYQNETIQHILETKTWKEKDSIKVQLKQRAGLDYADEHNMTYTILFDEDVAKLGLDIEKLKLLPGLELM